MHDLRWSQYVHKTLIGNHFRGGQTIGETISRLLEYRRPKTDLNFKTANATKMLRGRCKVFSACIR
jgi:hypothetical protein